MTDAQHTLGQILTGYWARDAIHIALYPVISDEDWLSAGDEIGFVYGTRNLVKSKPHVYGQSPLGVVDPFLKEPVRKGQQFWMFLMPNTVTGMRHHWEHPAFDGEPEKPKNDAEAWLRKFADSWNFDYDEMIANASNLGPAPYGNYITAQGIDLHSAGELGEDEKLFWSHLQTLTGKSFTQEHRENFSWSCSC